MPAFRSDNNAPICPEALAALADLARADHALGYGADSETERAVAAIRDLFSPQTHVFFVPTGTAANCLSIASLVVGRPWSRVLCHGHSHYNDDESTAPELLTGCRTTTITPVSLADPAGGIPASKLTPDDVRRAAAAGGRNDVHQPAPGVLTISNPTEFGEVYTPDETRSLCETAHALGYLVHVDGARFANAVACLLQSPSPLAGEGGLAERGRERGGTPHAPDPASIPTTCRALTTDAGVDALSFGGTKNGLALGEGALFFPREDGRIADEAAKAFPFLRKRAGHLLSKHRFLSAPFAATLHAGAWIRHAAHANAMATRLDAGLRARGFELPFHSDTNAVFVRLTERAERSLRDRGHGFYMFGDPAWRIGRLMCAFDTREQDVDALLEDAPAVGR